MGVLKELQCPSCYKKWRLCLGHGRKHSSLGRVMKLFPDPIQKQIAACKEGGALHLFHFQYQTAVCRQCQEMIAVPVLVLKEKESGQTLTGTCPICGGEAELLDENSAITCPKCQKAELDRQDVGLWD